MFTLFHSNVSSFNSSRSLFSIFDSVLNKTQFIYTDPFTPFQPQYYAGRSTQTKVIAPNKLAQADKPNTDNPTEQKWRMTRWASCLCCSWVNFTLLIKWKLFLEGDELIVSLRTRWLDSTITFIEQWTVLTKIDEVMALPPSRQLKTV